MSISSEDEIFLRLLTLNESRCSESALLDSPMWDIVRRIKQECIACKVGVPHSERQFNTLNTIILKLTNACNLACSYCYDYEKMEGAQRLELQMGLQAIKQALSLCDKVLWVILHGGEPMLMWDTVEYLVRAGTRIAKEQGKKIYFSGQTNMTCLTERIVRFSCQYNIVWGFSIDGKPEIHNHFRIDHQGKGSYELFIRSYKLFPSFVKRCGVMSTITAVNDSRLLETARHIKALGMASWDWSLFQPIGRGRKQSTHFKFDLDRLLTSWDELFNAVESGEFDGFPVLPVKKYLDAFVSGPAGNMCMRPQCGAARDLLSVSADGTIEACDCIDPTGPLSNLGNMQYSTLEAAKSSPTAEKIRSRDVTCHVAACADCIWYGVCGGTCLAHAPGLHDVWAESCAISQLAFDRISDSLMHSDHMLRYLNSLRV